MRWRRSQSGTGGRRLELRVSGHEHHRNRMHTKVFFFRYYDTEKAKSLRVKWQLPSGKLPKARRGKG